MHPPQYPGSYSIISEEDGGTFNRSHPMAITPKPIANQRVQNRTTTVAAVAIARSSVTMKGTTTVSRAIMLPSVNTRPPGNMVTAPAKVAKA
jgi:hypothetical protein